MRIQTQLARALDREEFYLEYQPSVDLHEGCITGLEALLRWRHPERGMVSPATFIPLAEEQGLIGPIGEMVLRTACRQLRSWLDEGLSLEKISVNVSGQQLGRSDFANVVECALRDAGLSSGHLELELTEATLTQDGRCELPLEEQIDQYLTEMLGALERGDEIPDRGRRQPTPRR